jgi:hypothetical protein
MTVARLRAGRARTQSSTDLVSHFHLVPVCSQVPGDALDANDTPFVPESASAARAEGDDDSDPPTEDDPDD